MSADPVERSRDFTVIPAGGGEVRLHSLTLSLAVGGPAMPVVTDLLALLDAGPLPRAELVARLRAHGEPAVTAAIDHLLSAGVLRPATSPWPHDEHRRLRSQVAFFEHFVAPDAVLELPGRADEPRSGADFQRMLDRSRVMIVGLGRLGSGLARDLALAGVGTIIGIDAAPVGDADAASDAVFNEADRGRRRSEALADHLPAVIYQPAAPPRDWDALLSEATFAVVCPDHHRPAELRAVNRAALNRGTPWTSARLTGFELHIGPTVLPGRTACYECAEARLRSNSADLEESAIVEAFRDIGRLRQEIPAFTPGTSLLSLEVLKALCWFATPASCSHLVTLDFLRLRLDRHPVLKVPRCPACGTAAVARPTILAWQREPAGTETVEAVS